MDAVTFDNVDEEFFKENKRGRKKDEVYLPKEVTGVARRLTHVLFDEIVEDSPTQSRREVFNPGKNKEDLELLNSIKANGIITPIIVRKLGDGDDKQGKRVFALVAGHRRIAAGKAAGLKGADGYATKANEDHEVLTVVENSGRRELSSFEKGLSLQSLKERRDLSVRKLAEVAGLSKSYVSELIQALQSPAVLINIWGEGGISPRSVVLLKDHWPLIEKEDTVQLQKILRNISREQAIGLNNQLNAGKSLKKALVVIKSTAKTTSGKTDSMKSAAGSVIDTAGLAKDVIIPALVEVFPRIKEKRARVLYDYAVVEGVQDPNVIWASALYVDGGGKIDQAVELTKKAFGTRKIKKLLVQQVNLMKEVALHLNTMTKEDKSIIDFINIVFSSRR